MELHFSRRLLPFLCFYFYFGVFTFDVLLFLLRYAFTFGVLNGVGNSSSLSPRETLDTVEVWISFNNFKMCFFCIVPNLLMIMS